MGLHRFRPTPSGRMGILWTLSTINEAVLVEFGSMGHMLYAREALKRVGVNEGCKLYSTHIDETDVSLGSTKRLSDTIKHIVEKENPKIIFLLPSTVPEIIGTDLPAICEELQAEFPYTRFIPFEHGGFNIGQHRGISEALLLLAKTLPKNVLKTEQPTFNLIGSCADLYRFQADANELTRLLQGAFGIKPICIMTSHTSVSDLEQMGGAHINIVIRQEGELAAKQLYKRFGTPFLTLRPYGIQHTFDWLNEIGRILDLQPNQAFVMKEMNEIQSLIKPVLPIIHHLGEHHPEKLRMTIGGHADVVKGIIQFGSKELSLQKGVCWCDCPEMGTAEVPYFTEKQWYEVLHNEKEGIMMASGEALESVGRSTSLQISHPGSKWSLNPYDPPFVGFRGALHLINLWINEEVSHR